MPVLNKLVYLFISGINIQKNSKQLIRETKSIDLLMVKGNFSAIDIHPNESSAPRSLVLQSSRLRSF